MFGEPKNVTKFRPFGCRAYPYLNDSRRETGKHISRAAEGVHLGFATDSNTSRYVIHVPSTGKTYTTNQVRFDECAYPYRKQEIIDQHIRGQLENLLKVDSPITWELWNHMIGHAVISMRRCITARRAIRRIHL